MSGREEKTGASASPGPILKNLLVDAGFVDVREQVHQIPVGSWARDKKLKQVGRYYRVALEEGLNAISMRILTQLLGWEVLEAGALNAHFRKELDSVKFDHQ